MNWQKLPLSFLEVGKLTVALQTGWAEHSPTAALHDTMTSVTPETRLTLYCMLHAVPHW